LKLDTDMCPTCIGHRCIGHRRHVRGVPNFIAYKSILILYLSTVYCWTKIGNLKKLKDQVYLFNMRKNIEIFKKTSPTTKFYLLFLLILITSFSGFRYFVVSYGSDFISLLFKKIFLGQSFSPFRRSVMQFMSN